MGNADMKTNQTGFSLVEMMVAMTISLVLVLGVATIMISSKRSYNVQQDMARMQENARFAIEFLNKDLRMAGYFGCSGEIPGGLTPLAGREGGTGLKSDAILVSFVETNQNAFSVVHSTNPTPLQEGTMIFTPTVRGELFVGDTVVASDCGSSEAYTISVISNNNQITLTRDGRLCKSTTAAANGLCKDYNNNGNSFGAEIRRVVTYRYFVAQTDDGGVSLFRDKDRDTNGGSLDINDVLDIDSQYVEELIQGVENMQIRYGVNSAVNNNANMVVQYQTADNVALWDRVVSVRIYLVVNTMKERFDKESDTQTYNVGEMNDEYEPPSNDHRRRTVFNTTVMLRN